MTDEPIRTGAIPNCQCHQRIAQLESALEVLANRLGCGDCPDDKSSECPSHGICPQCWIDWAMEEAKK